jgi:23S rRNA (cytosine1962-C5)-methyltransferase
MYQFLTPDNFIDYELIDTGNFEKLEQFGKYIVARPEPQAIWDKSLTEKDWNKMAQAYFRRDKNYKSDNIENYEKGEWILKSEMPNQWFVQYNYKSMHLKMRLGFTSFKHIGIFPEQAVNWDFIYDTIQNIKSEKSNILNLFAYTGGASLAARAAGASVTHVDSVKQVISWSRENMEASGLSDIRWIVDDVIKFVQREIRRGKKYNGIILDPPAYGRGPDGEKWILEKSINDLIKNCRQLLNNENSFLLLNLYSMGYSAIIAESLVKSIFSDFKSIETGELLLKDKTGRNLPLGIFSRFTL